MIEEAPVARALKRATRSDDDPTVTRPPHPRARARRMRRARAAVVVVLLVAVPSPAWAEAGTGTVTVGAEGSAPQIPSGTAPGIGEDAVEAPTEKDLQTQREYLEALEDDVAGRSDALTKAEADRAAAAAAATVALEEYSDAERALAEANAAENVERDKLLQARLELAAQRSELGRWAREAYREGQVNADYGAILTVLSAGPTDDLSNTLASINRIGRSRGRVVERYEAARLVQEEATRTAEAATQKAVVAATAAREATQTRDAALAEQQRTVIALQQQLSIARSQEAAARKQTQVMQETADRAAAYLVGRAGTGETGDCAGQDVSGYPNGRIPLEALCPVWGAPGHHLRADAAYAFDQLSQAYAHAFGGPICVTDSYRTYDEQVDLYRRKPNLAAHPGTSNHGWGTAADLCGGIQSFDTAQHQWMVVNAPAFGWFHPSWARQTGSRPEPWHFEYGG